MSKRGKPRSSKHQDVKAYTDNMLEAINRANDLVTKGRYEEAAQLLEPLAARYPRLMELHGLLGSAYAGAGKLWKAIVAYEKALSLRKDADLLVSIGFLYSQLDLQVLALDAFRQALKSGAQEPLRSQLPNFIQKLEDQLLEVSRMMNLSPVKTAKGLRLMEEGQIALSNAEYARSINLNRNAIRLLGDFPPAHNNLSLALYFHGMPDEAIRVARQVVDRFPDNIQALANLVRFLSWTGKEEEARRVWEQLKPLTPPENTARIKKVEAAAIMQDDETVLSLLKIGAGDEEQDSELARRMQLFLAIAEANTGRERAAKRHLAKLQQEIPWAGQILEALRAGKRGLGWAERFPYFHITELLPSGEFEALFELLKRQGKMPEAKFRREVERYVARFPQIVLMAKRTLLEEQQIDAAVDLLKILGTPEAYAVLREFGLGQSGDEKARMQALFALLEAGQISENETVRFWQDGEWREIQLKQYDIVESHELNYDPQVIDLLDRALKAFQKDRLAEAEKLYQRVLTLEPRAKEAYNNLGTVYARQDKHDQAQAMFRKAIEIEPLYVMPCCNLALYLLGEDKVEEAEEMIAPLAGVTQLHPQELALLSYVRALILVGHEEYDRARKQIEVALQVYPDFEPAKDYLKRLETLETLRTGWKGFFEKQRQRDRAKRERQRTILTTPDLTLAEALSIYTKDVLTAIARLIIPWGGWSALKKAELHQYLVDYLSDADSRQRVIESLSPEARKAFEYVRDRGGTVAWDLFDQNFGNDLDESPYWQYHEPQTVMGSLRAHGLLAEANVNGEPLVTIPVELRS